MRHHYFFQFHFQPKLTKFAGDIFNGSLCLQRAAEPRSNVIRQMRLLTIGVITSQSSLLNLFDL